MSFVHTFVGSSFLVLVGSGILQAVLPGPAPIIIHDLEYENGHVTQKRTVTSKDGVFFAQWRAEVVDYETNAPVIACTGAGSWNYSAGYAEPVFTLADWTGNPACDVDDLPTSFYLRATWRWGDDQTSKSSDIYAKGAMQ